MSVVFADTFYWIALTNRRDSAHRAVMQFTTTLAPRAVVTNDEVLTEFLAYCASDQALRQAAGLAVSRLLNDPDIRVVAQSRDSFLDGLALYNARPDKGYSLTDCISMQTMRKEGLTDVLTSDRHFEQEGFHALFRELCFVSPEKIDNPR
jgi:predicted nucleic acid-binding protein